MVRDVHAIHSQSTQFPTGIAKATIPEQAKRLFHNRQSDPGTRKAAIEAISPPSIEHAAFPSVRTFAPPRAKSGLSLLSTRSQRHSTLVAIGANSALS
jgi:hypothetical protein